MNEHYETLEDLIVYLECARDGLLMIHNVLEAETATTKLLMSAVYGTYNHLDFIAREIQKHIEHIPAEVLRKAGEEVSA